MELTNTQMEINTKAIGIGICRMEEEPTTTLMEISTRVSGSTAGNMETATIFIPLRGESIKEAGNKGKSKVLGNLLLKISMAILATGTKTRRKAEDATSTPTARGTRATG